MFFGRAEYILTGGQYFDDLNTLRQDPYALVNFRLGIEREHFDIYGFVNNALDERYRNSGVAIFSPVAIVGTLRNYGVEMRLRF